MTETLRAPNQDQAALWNADAGRNWVTMQDLLDRLFEPVGAVVVEAAFPSEGGRVLDLGCGSGATTLAMARRVGPGGRCLGVDISLPLVEAAAGRAEAEGVFQAAFTVADAQTHPFEPAGFDAAISRFGVMFFDDPVAAFANVRRAVRLGGRLVFAAWRSPAENPFMTTAAHAVESLLPGLPRYVPDAPGQFGFAREARMREILDSAGWRGIEVAPLDVPGVLREADLKAYVARMGPIGLALQQMDEAERRPVFETALAAFDPFLRDGAARFDMALWLVTAEA